MESLKQIADQFNITATHVCWRCGADEPGAAGFNGHWQCDDVKMCHIRGRESKDTVTLTCEECSVIGYCLDDDDLIHLLMEAHWSHHQPNIRIDRHNG